MKTGAKIKLLKILEILQRDSDEEHPLSTYDICNKLEEIGIECDRKVLAKDIQLLIDNDYDIVQNKQKGLTTTYFIGDRSFNIPELRILMDATQAASFITSKKTAELLDKIANLGGSHRARLLKRNTWFNTTKHTNEEILYSINEIETAITTGKQISFRYFDYNAAGQREYRKDGERYTVNPLKTIYTADNYYLVCYSDKHKTNLAHYRIDRMENVDVENTNITPTAIGTNFDASKHYNQVFGMFSGETKEVTFLVHKEILGAVRDKFGETVKFTPKDENRYYFTATVQLSPQFIGWCCMFGELLKVIEPTNVVENIKSHISSLNNSYQYFNRLNEFLAHYKQERDKVEKIKQNNIAH